MTNKQKIIIGLIIVVTIAVIAIVVSNKSKTQAPVATPSVAVPTQENIENTQQPVLETKAPDTTVEGVVIAINGDDIAISNNTPEPTLIGITGATPVVKLDKNGKETPAGLADVKAGGTARVLFNQDSSENKVAEKIYLIGK